MNYAALRVAVQDYTENTFSDTDFAQMTVLAEQKIYNSVQLPALRRNVTGLLSASVPYLSTPTDFLSVFSLAVISPAGSYTYLLNKDVNFMREAYPNPTATGLPKYYAIFGPDSFAPNEFSLILGPTPDLAYGVELHYFFYPTSITTAGTSWVSENFESVLVNAVLVETARFMKAEQDIVAIYDTQYQQSLTLLKNLSDGKLRQDSYRSGQVRTKVI
jgi:hypothetical protein